MGEAKRISDRIKLQKEQSEREISMHRRAQKAEGENSNLRSEIERLEKEVERIKQTKNMWRDGFKRVMHERDTAWDDAIEAAAEKVNTLAADHPTIVWAVNEIRALKRSHE